MLSDEITVLHATMRPAPAPPGQPRAGAYRGRLAGGGQLGGRGLRGAGSRVASLGLPGQLVTDDRGTTSTASFSGGGSHDEWRGRFEAHPPLAPDTAWIEVLGERIGLPSEPSAGVQVRVEPLPDADLATQVRVVAGGLFQGSGTTPGTNAAPPEPWRSLLARRGRAGGPQGLAVAGATTPPLDGFTLALLALRSTDERFCADVQTVPGLPHWQ